MDKILFSTRLAERRKECGYKTQYALAKEYNKRFPSTRKNKKEENAENASGIFGTIKNYENENHKGFPRLDIVDNLCTILECDVDYLLGNIDCKKHDTQFIHDKTGLSEKAINSLIARKELHELFPDLKNDKIDVINIILQDNHKKTSLSSALDLITGFCRFNISDVDNKSYTVDQKGITPFQGHKTLSGKGFSYNPMQAHFHLEDMESMYYLKIWDSIKELKEMYNESKAPDTN